MWAVSVPVSLSFVTSGGCSISPHLLSKPSFSVALFGPVSAFVCFFNAVWVALAGLELSA